MLFDLNVLVCIADLSRYESGKAGVDAQVATAVFLKNECDTWKDNLLRQFHRKRTLRGRTVPPQRTDRSQGWMKGLAVLHLGDVR